MGITSIDLTQGEPVHFRVVGAQLNPIPSSGPSNEIVLTVELLNEPPRTHHIGLPRDWYAPYREALSEAAKTQAVYWVDWSKKPHWPPRMNDSTIERLLRAVQDRQLVSPNAGTGDEEG